MFELITISNSQVVVRHKTEGHVYVFHLPHDRRHPLNQTPSVRPCHLSDHDFADFLEPAYQFAHTQAREAGVAS